MAEKIGLSVAVFSAEQHVKDFLEGPLSVFRSVQFFDVSSSALDA